jgi:hypothetical protein
VVIFGIVTVGLVSAVLLHVAPSIQTIVTGIIALTATLIVGVWDVLRRRG